MKNLSCILFFCLLAGCNPQNQSPAVSTGLEGGHGTPSGPINLADKESVRAAYKQEFSTGFIAPEWTGSFQNCAPGTTSLQFQQSVINRISFYRQMAGLPGVQLVPNLGDYQAAALMMGANGTLSHNPPSDWKCYSQSGASGAGSSNLSIGSYGTSAIDLYMDDFGGLNSAVGHRRWLLNAARTHFATGDVSGGNGGEAANSLSVWQASGTSPHVEMIAWPPAGFVPVTIMPSASQRWSMSYSAGDLSQATVSMKNLTAGKAIATKIEPFYPGFGEPTLVWQAPEVSYVSSTQDIVYEVTVGNIQTSSGVKSKTYQVIVFSP